MTAFYTVGPVLFMGNLVYFEQKPQFYTCFYADGTSKQCNLQEICSSEASSLVKWEVDTSVPYLRNLITDLGITCTSKLEIGLIGSMYFLGEAFMSFGYMLYVRRVTGMMSRLKHLQVRNLIMAVVLTILVSWVRSLPLLYLCVFLIGAGQAVQIIQGYTYLIESMPFKHRNIVSTIVAMIDKVILVSTTLALKYQDDSNWVTIMVPGLFFAFFATLHSLFLLDSP